MASGKLNVGWRLWRRISSSWPYPPNERDRRRLLRSHLILHFRAPSVNAETLRFTLTWGLGGMTATLIALQLATGMLLKFVYAPSPVAAYASVQTIIGEVPFGRLVRNLHYWSANLLVATVSLHLLRVFFTGAFHPPRQLNWVIGLLLFLLVLTSNLSGYLLPYDQLAYWAVTVITAMLGYIPVVGSALPQALASSGELGPQALPFFYTLHTALLPFLLIVLMGFHFWRIRKAGGLVIPRRPGAPLTAMPVRVPVVPNLVLRELATALAVTAVVFVGALLGDAALTEPANPGMSPNPVRAPWYFAGLQELLLHVHPTVAVSLVPVTVALFLVSIPYLPYAHSSAGVWFASERGKRQCVAVALTTVALSVFWIVVGSQLVQSASWVLPLSPIWRSGILPLALVAVCVAGGLWMLRQRSAASLNELVQAAFVMLITAVIVMTTVGVFFRGPGMTLIWPF